jgi:hypothetical protein
LQNDYFFVEFQVGTEEIQQLVHLCTTVTTTSKYKITGLNELIIEKVEQIINKNKQHTDSKNIDVNTNGIIKSIFLWCKHNTIFFDKEQLRAFEILTTTFILTYYYEANNKTEANL